MNEKLNQYLNGVFAPYEGVKSVAELKADLLSDLQERFRELKAEGKDDETALAMTIDSIGEIEQTVQEAANLSRSLERQLLINFSASNLTKSDFAGVTAHKGKFEASALRGSDFSGADLTGSSFKASDVREANFDRANLTGPVIPLSAPVATFTSSLSHITPRISVEAVQASPAASKAAVMARMRGVRSPESSPMIVRLPRVPAITSPGAVMTPPA